MPTVTYLKTVSDGNVKTILQRIADQLNKDITVHSGDRPAAQTVKGSNSGSLHVAKRAADFHIKGVTDTHGFAFFKANMNKIFDQTEAYEVIQHRPGGATEGPHLHIGRYGLGPKGHRSGYIDFKLDGLEFGKRYNVTRMPFTNPNGVPIEPAQGKVTAYNAGANGSPANVSQSVGKFGKNQADDVRQVQFLLNLALRKMTEANFVFQKYNPIIENGVCGDDTIQAITIFQRDIIGWKEPDGRVDAGGKTLQMLYIAAYNPTDAVLQRRMNKAKTVLGTPDGGAVEWNGTLAWGAHPNVSAEFRDKTVRISRELGIKNPSWLMSVMAFETMETFSPSVKNAMGSSGTGLIQFMKETIDGRTDKKGKFHPGLGAKLGITHSQLAGMTAVRQLDVVKAYFQQFGNKAARATKVDDLYFLVLYPKAYGLDLDDPVFYKGTKEYRDNNFDSPKAGGNDDGIVQAGEISRKIRETLQKGLGKYPFTVK